MKISKYVKPLIISFSGLIIIFLSLLLLLGGGPGFLILFSFSMPIDSLIIFILTLISSIICGYIMGYALGPLFVLIHKKTVGRKMVYGIEKRPETDKFKGYFTKALWPALLSINLAVTFAFNETIQTLLTSVPSVEIGSIMAAWATFIVLLPITTGISLSLFSPILYLMDSGIIYHNKERIKDMRDSTEVRNIGNWYNNILKGYAGIAVILSYYGFIEQIVEDMIASPDSIGGYFSAFILVVYPVVIVLLIVPTIVVLDMTYKKRKSFIIKRVEKFQIDKPMEVDLK